ncbi:hypothetical protein AB9P05_24100 [Roseivirga sp. BDSF3-8]|uniref:hypothetical protein n=1 Tax=Roseivirga sp. BDSF3-8 TaxID=3241598 RepID=UPI003531ACA8
MRKEKLSLRHLKVTSFKTSAIKRINGGDAATQYEVYCDSVRHCETIDHSACYGDQICKRYY